MKLKVKFKVRGLELGVGVGEGVEIRLQSVFHRICCGIYVNIASYCYYMFSVFF